MVSVPARHASPAVAPVHRRHKSVFGHSCCRLPCPGHGRRNPARPPPRGNLCRRWSCWTGHMAEGSGAIGYSGHTTKACRAGDRPGLRRQLQSDGRTRRIDPETDVFIPLDDRVSGRSGMERRCSSRCTRCTDGYSVRGASVYTLAQNASDAQSAALARRENSADASSAAMAAAFAGSVANSGQPGAAGNSHWIRVDRPAAWSEVWTATCQCWKSRPSRWVRRAEAADIPACWLRWLHVQSAR